MSVRYADIAFRPIDRWPGAHSSHRRTSQFSAPWDATIDLLERELSHLGAKLVVLQIAISEDDLRIDGKLRAAARPSHPGVVLAFQSKFGPLKYASDEFLSWRDNLRAIALSMEALRKVDRYGVSKRGEQYMGWRAIPASTDPADAIQTREQAEAILAQFGGDWKAAVRATHPDSGGDEAEFRKVMRAKELLS